MRRAALSGKKILVTAGPTWVALDSVRVISNVSTGAMGLLLAKKGAAMGADVDLLLGPVEINHAISRVNVFRYTFFNELKNLIASRLKKKSYDIILHAAAVSDYVTRTRRGKISSGKKSLNIRLERAPKLAGLMRTMNPRAILVMFKLEDSVPDAVLIQRSRRALRAAKADMVVANRFEKGSYRGFVVDRDSVSIRCASRACLAGRLFDSLKRKSAR